MRIGVTGSRTWKNKGIITAAFDDIEVTHPVVIIEGGNPRGADRLCRAEAWSRGWHVATVEALWNYYGKSAGHIRNDVMTTMELHLWLAFICPCDKKDCPVPAPHDSHGTSGGIDRAKAAGIPVREYREEQPGTSVSWVSDGS